MKEERKETPFCFEEYTDNIKRSMKREMCSFVEVDTVTAKRIGVVVDKLVDSWETMHRCLSEVAKVKGEGVNLDYYTCFLDMVARTTLQAFDEMRKLREEQKRAIDLI